MSSLGEGGSFKGQKDFKGLSRLSNYSGLYEFICKPACMHR